MWGSKGSRGAAWNMPALLPAVVVGCFCSSLPVSMDGKRHGEAAELRPTAKALLVLEDVQQEAQGAVVTSRSSMLLGHRT